MTGKRVFLLDDHEVVRAGIRAVLDSEPDLEVVGEWDAARGAVDAILDAQPDVAVFDVRLPDGSGSTCSVRSGRRTPRSRGWCSPASRTTTRSSPPWSPAPPASSRNRSAIDTLVSSVRLVASGHSMIDPAVVLRLTERQQPVLDGAPGLADLTPTERRVLVLVAQGMTNRQIGDQLSLAEKTVKNHVTSILAKLRVTRRTQAALLAAKLGVA